MRTRAAVAILAVCVSVCMSLTSPVKAEGRGVLVIPSRYAVVQFAFDVASFKPISLVAYDLPKGATEPVFFLWDTGVQQWIRITRKEFSSASVFAGVPSPVIVVGADAAARAVSGAAEELGKVKAIPSLNIMDMANGLNEALGFSSAEWKWLARRHNIELKDLNAERRRYGRYGKPGSEPVMPSSHKEMPMPAAGSAILMPVKQVEVVKPADTMGMEPVDLPEVAAPKVVNPEDK